MCQLHRKTQLHKISLTWESPKCSQNHSNHCVFYHVRYLSHLAFLVGSSNWVHKTRIHSIQRWHPLAPKLADPLLYYVNLSVRWNTLVRSQILLCQHIFYYILVPLCCVTWIDTKSFGEKSIGQMSLGWKSSDPIPSPNLPLIPLTREHWLKRNAQYSWPPH